MAKKIQNEEPRDSVLDAIKMLAKERGIDEEELIAAVEDGIAISFRKEFSMGQKQANPIRECGAEIDRETGEIFVYKLVEVVDVVTDPVNQISLEEAQAIDSEIEIKDKLEMGLDVEMLGRIAATAAKTAISAKVREAEFKRIQSEFQIRKGEITSGVILRSDARNVYVDIDRAEAVLPKSNQIRGEEYKTGAIMKFLIQDVVEHNGRPSIIVTRASAELVHKVFESIVPEIHDGLVEIKAVSREPGSRSKVAVASRNPDVDAKGACVGPRGMRVQQVMEEIGGEKIDIVDWNADDAIFISEALQPAKVLRVDVEITTMEDGRQNKTAVVVVPDDQFTLAIGRSGQNVRLTVRLTGFKIDIKKESEVASEATQNLLDSFSVEEGE